jgi:nicotinate-nucleotide pyrophosphorylase (carboxylating)
LTTAEKLAAFRNEIKTSAVELALYEDISDGDITTSATIPPDSQSTAVIKAKSDGVLAGLDVAKYIFKMSETPLKVKSFKKDGDALIAGDLIAEVSGSTQSLLIFERTVLNFMQRMSGIATETRKYVEAVKGTTAKILDTRKTAPALRFFDKEAVAIGGGTNHRIGLYDQFLIKDNHSDAAGGVAHAIRAAKEYAKANGLKVKLEVEVRSMAELSEALAEKPDIVLLDNMSVAELEKAVRFARTKSKSVLLEASGGVTLDAVKAIAETGVDFISVGGLTHSVRAMDISMKITKA